MFRIVNDHSQAMITAKDQIHSPHRDSQLKLPEKAIVFFMSKAIDYLKDNLDAIQMEALFPRFLNKCPIYEIKDLNICFLDGGRGAPQAVDTIETLKALGVKTVISVDCMGHMQVV